LKLQFFTHQGETEIGGFGISAEDDPLYVEEFVTVEQRSTSVSVHFEDQAVADYFDHCVDRKLPLDRCARLWMHTHPCASPEPSSTDERTFARVFGRCDWSLMFILGRTGLTYARLSFSAGPGGSQLLPVSVDWASWPAWLAIHNGELPEVAREWQAEFAANVRSEPLLVIPEPQPASAQETLLLDDWWDMLPWIPELDEVRYQSVEELYDDILLR